MQSMYIFIIGLFMGSFLYCITISGISLRRSRCDNCGHELSCFDLVPLLSFLFLKGRCRYCKEKLDSMYPLSELITAGVYLLVFYRYEEVPELMEYLIVASVMLMISFRDLMDMTIPDCLIVIGIAVHLFFHPESFIHDLPAGLAVSFFLLVLTLIMEKLCRKEMMGLGDIKLVFMLGMNVSVYDSIKALFIASVTALVIEMFRKKVLFPFGPYICLGYFAVFVFLP